MLPSARARASSSSFFHGTSLLDRPRLHVNTQRHFCATIRADAAIQGKSMNLFPAPPSVEGTLGDKFAVIEVGGAQQIVEEGKNYTCHRLNVPPGSLVKLPRVLAVRLDGELTLGEPYLPEATVEAEIVEDYRAPKIFVFKYRPKKHYRKRRGHRQEMTRFKITKISKQ